MAFDIDFQRCLETFLTDLKSSSSIHAFDVGISRLALVEIQSRPQWKKTPLSLCDLWIHASFRAKILKHESLPADPRVQDTLYKVLMLFANYACWEYNIVACEYVLVLVSQHMLIH